MGQGRWYLVVLIAIVGLASACAINEEQGARTTPSAAPSSRTANGDLGQLENQAFAGVNEVRTEEGVPTLMPNPTLTEVARAYSCRMAQEDFFAHESPEGRDVSDRVNDAGVRYQMVGENLAKMVNVEDPAAAAVEGWMESPGHRENMLRKEYSETGMGVCRNGNAYYFTQIFLQPR